MNGLIIVENAKVVNKDAFATGTNDKGPWASIRIKVEWEYQDLDGQTKKMSAYVIFKGELAATVRDFIEPGNPYAQPAVPETFVKLWLRTYADKREYSKRDGGKGEDKETLLIGEKLEVYGKN